MRPRAKWSPDVDDHPAEEPDRQQLVGKPLFINAKSAVLPYTGEPAGPVQPSYSRHITRDAEHMPGHNGPVCGSNRSGEKQYR